ncbi:MAG: helix-turn-helix transcriptional regulator [Halobacteriovoraceae bacterium]|jgi:transcriptional regulator with XRE-family HTH domain|nr:helix-turn-helix transcriptional regulator [Halobacteriovoraceae bacterium]
MKKDTSKFKTRAKRERRSDRKIMTKEASLLKYMRESRHLSMRRVAPILGLSEATVNHSENGRRDIDEKLIKSFLKVYGYSYIEFKLMLEGEIEVPEHIRSECVDILNRLAENKLKMVKAFLVTL